MNLIKGIYTLFLFRKYLSCSIPWKYFSPTGKCRYDRMSQAQQIRDCSRMMELKWRRKKIIILSIACSLTRISFNNLTLLTHSEFFFLVFVLWKNKIADSHNINHTPQLYCSDLGMENVPQVHKHHFCVHISQETLFQRDRP